ncbi:hypothetical protein GOP47_0024439 [Adiantum capillus-veneris]|uniref:Acid phosphatase n=1 Tax=Adiantum capillus-veneris TaxID=13818 RepID=A0A9D4U1W3_ADICA|nr:hypothetical protein GOP47_0024439 [Adiantum capillus-veneris]
MMMMVAANCSLQADLPTTTELTDDQHCTSWRYNVDVNNLRSWWVVPNQCENIVENYMRGSSYRYDSAQAMQEAETYARTFMYSADYNSSTRYTWIFAIDDTCLSNLPYYSSHRFGAEPLNSTLYKTWIGQGKAPALQATLQLFNTLKEWDYTILLLSGRLESQREATIQNLIAVGYADWEALILRKNTEIHVDATSFKSKKRKYLEDNGYTIIGNVGDQWSDLTGQAVGDRVFKLPNPMYYVA